MISRTFIWNIFLLCCLSSTFSLNGQPSSGGDIFIAFSSPSVIDTNSLRLLFLCRSGEQLENTKFTRQFLEAEWKEGGVLDYSGAVYPVEARYRIIDDEMLILSGDDVCVLQKPSVRAVQVDHRIFISVEYFNKREEVDNGYFELLTDGRIRLLRNLFIRNDQVKEQFYLQVDEAPAFKYKGRRNDLLPLMTDQQQSMEEYLENSSIQWKDAEDLIIIIDHYHRLRSGT